MFFQKLSALLAVSTSVSIVMTQKNDKITLAVQPKLKGDKPAQPLLITGTAQEIDEQFPQIWGRIEEGLSIISNDKSFIESLKSNQSDNEEKSESTKPTASGKANPRATRTTKENKEKEPVQAEPATTNPAVDLFSAAAEKAAQTVSQNATISQPTETAEQVLSSVTAAPEPVVQKAEQPAVSAQPTAAKQETKVAPGQAVELAPVNTGINTVDARPNLQITDDEDIF